MNAPGALDHTPHDAVRELEARVREAASLDEVVLPPYPAVALRVQQAIAKDAFGAAEVARIIGSDSALAADVLRCASSAYYRRAGAVTNLTQALTRIGAQQALRLAFTCVLAGRAHQTGTLAPLRRLVWLQAVASGAVCEALAHARRLRSNEAFTLGLLHDFGKLVAVWRLEALLDASREPAAAERRPPLAVCAEVVERQHVALGSALASRWGLSPLAAQVVAGHHDPDAPCEDPALLDVVRTSDRVVALLSREVGVSPEALAAVPGLAAWERRAVAGVLEKLPELLSAFEPADFGPRPSAADTEPQCDPVPTFPVRPAFDVLVRVGGRAASYAAVALGEGAVVVAGKEPLAGNRLVSATLACGRDPLTIWALPQGSRPKGGAHHVELRPFGLDGAARQRWQGLLAHCSA